MSLFRYVNIINRFKLYITKFSNKKMNKIIEGLSKQKTNFKPTVTDDEFSRIIRLLGPDKRPFHTARIDLYTSQGPQWNKKDDGFITLVLDVEENAYFLIGYSLEKIRKIFEYKLGKDTNYTEVSKMFFTLKTEECLTGFNFKEEGEGAIFKEAIEKALKILKSDGKKKVPKSPMRILRKFDLTRPRNVKIVIPVEVDGQDDLSATNQGRQLIDLFGKSPSQVNHRSESSHIYENTTSALSPHDYNNVYTRNTWQVPAGNNNFQETPRRLSNYFEDSTSSSSFEANASSSREEVEYYEVEEFNGNGDEFPKQNQVEISPPLPPLPKRPPRNFPITNGMSSEQNTYQNLAFKHEVVNNSSKVLVLPPLPPGKPKYVNPKPMKPLCPMPVVQVTNQPHNLTQDEFSEDKKLAISKDDSKQNNYPPLPPKPMKFINKPSLPNRTTVLPQEIHLKTADLSRFMVQLKLDHNNDKTNTGSGFYN